VVGIVAAQLVRAQPTEDECLVLNMRITNLAAEPVVYTSWGDPSAKVIRMAMVRQDLPRVEAHFQQMKWDHRHWEPLRRYHGRLGPKAFWRLARKYKDIERLLAALKEEAQPRDSTRGRLARGRTAREEWEVVVIFQRRLHLIAMTAC